MGNSKQLHQWETYLLSAYLHEFHVNQSEGGKTVYAMKQI